MQVLKYPKISAELKKHLKEANNIDTLSREWPHNHPSIPVLTTCVVSVPDFDMYRAIG